MAFKFVTSVTIFSLVSLVRTGICSSPSNIKQSIASPEKVANIIFHGIAKGTFLYITFFEAFHHVFALNKNILP